MAEKLSKTHRSDLAVTNARTSWQKHLLYSRVSPRTLGLLTLALGAAALVEFAMAISHESIAHLGWYMAYIVAGGITGISWSIGVLGSYEQRLLAPIAGHAICLEAERLVADFSCARAIRDEALAQGRGLYVMDVVRMREAAKAAGATDVDQAVIDKAYAGLLSGESESHVA